MTVNELITTMTILICEDEEVMLTALDFRLRRHGFTIVRALDGLQATQALNEHPIDLVITDVDMPHKTGLQLLEEIRQEKPKLPVIIISGVEKDEIILEAFRLGANDFISKPFRPVELVVRVRRIMQQLGIEE